MTLLDHLVRREVLDHLRTFRFCVLMLLLIAVAIAGALLGVAQDRQTRVLYQQGISQARAQRQERLASEWPYVEVFRWNTPFIRPPAMVPFVADGATRSLPGVFQVNAFGMEGPEFTRSPNAALGSAHALDWGFVAGVVLSLAALVLTFDAICREREERTFHLVMANSISRSTVVVGKVLGAFLPITAAWALAILLELLLWNVLADAPLDSTDWAMVLLAQVPIVLLVLAFVALGLVISLLFHSPGTCGTVAALCWAFFVLVIPGTAHLLSDRLVHLPDPKVVQARAEEAADRVESALRHERGIHLSNRHWSRPDPLGPHLELEEAFDDELRTVRNQWQAQARLARQFSRLSPVAVLSCTLEELTDQGFAGYETFEQEAGEYQREMKKTLLSIYPLDLNEPMEGAAITRLQARPLHIEALPSPPSGRRAMADRLVAAGPDLALLALFAGGMLVAAVAIVSRQSVTG